MLPFPDRPAGTDCLPEIRHIVVLMMENHSFDNYLGALGRGDGLPLGPDGTPAAENPTMTDDMVASARLPSTRQVPRVPTQSWQATHIQWDDGGNDGFVRSVEECTPGGDVRIPMGYWTGEDLPFYYGLARTFPLADRWFSSCLGPTFPNRRFLVSGTANGLTSDQLTETLDYPPNGTVFDLLTRYGISWVNYHSVGHLKAVLKRVAGRHGLRAGRWLSRLLRPLRQESTDAKSFLAFTADAYPLGLLRYLRHLRTVDRFITDTRTGSLPAISIVDPDFRLYSEENPQDIVDGEAFAAGIINAVMAGADWSGTLLIWCYDEHGGYYDHVPPPAAPEPDGRRPRNGGDWRFDRYGFRVPAVVVSPYARPDYVSSVVRDHTAILKLIERKWNLPPLTARDRAADDLLDMIDLANPPQFAAPPRLPQPAAAR